ncbi:MAG TPA: response regulator [Leptolyngbyaceae cyanobacterium]
MSNDNNIREQGYQYFVTEAPELLQAIEQDLLTLREDYSLVKVHGLMRTTHTLKGAAANMGLETIKTIAHHLEDVFKSLYNPELTIDNELETLLFEGYECLRLPLMAQIQGGYVNDDEALDRAVAIFAQLEEKLGDYFGKEAQIPSSIELGFDITKSIFEVGVKQRLEELANVLNDVHIEGWQVEPALREQAEIFIGLAESLNLPGFGVIAQKTIAALDIHPEQAVSIAKVALRDFWEGWAAVIAGDRTSGGEPSFALQQLAGTILPASLQRVGDGESRRVGDEENQADVLFGSESIFSLDETAPELAHLVDFSTPLVELSLEEIFGNFAEEIQVEQPVLENPGLEKQAQKETAKIEKEKVEEHSIEQPIANSQPQVNSVNNGQSTNSNNVKTPRQTVRVELELLERLSYLAGELLINQNRLANIAEQLQDSVGRSRFRLRRHQQTMSQLRDWSDQMIIDQAHQRVLEIKEWPSKSDFDALELDQYNELHVLLQSVSEEMVQLEETIDSTDLLARQSGQILEKQRRLLNNVQDDMREARMLPVGEIFNRFPRLLQQLAAGHHKKVELTLHGTDVLVDRALADKLYDPLLHLVRNAFDHGIEPPEIRAARGKPETGQIEIIAYHQGNQTIIEVRDDGEGINFDRIRQRVVELQWMTAEKANNLSHTALLDLLFEPGFSTAAKVSDLSGRGIGLNVVRSQMDAVSGSVSVYGEPHRGTTFALQFPLTLTMAKLMVCESSGSVYALLSDAVEQIIIPKSEQIQKLEGQKVLRWQRGNSQCMVPIYNMTELLGYNPTSVPLFSTPLILLKQNQELMGLEVDQIVGEQELVIRPLGKAIAPPNYVYGGSTLADGRLTLVIDGNALVHHLLERMNQRSQISNLQWQIENKNPSFHLPAEIPRLQLKESDLSAPQLSTSSQLSDTPSTPLFPLNSSFPQILIVDDSISLRQTLALTLQKANYQVIQAQNGREALQQIRQNPGIQLVICDIEMPLMNGFEFLNNYRRDSALGKVPVVMLTSRRSEKHRLLALEMGAVDYFTKPYRDEEILNAIANLLNSKTPTLVRS